MGRYQRDTYTGVYMIKKPNTFLSIFVAGCITGSAILHSSKEEPHIHAERYYAPDFSTYSIVVSGTSSTGYMR
jgi:hypothetical protein